MWRNYLALLAIIDTMLILLLTACINPNSTIIQSALATPSPIVETEIPFETVALNEEGLVPSVSEDPTLMMITSATEIPAIIDRISFDDANNLRKVNFQNHIVIALFREMNLSTGYPTYIRQIVKRNHQLWVYAEFGKPAELSWQGASITATYHLVKISVQEQISANVDLVLQPQVITATPVAR